VTVASGYFAYRDLVKSLKASDETGMHELRQSGDLIDVPIGTHIKILEYHEDFLASGPVYEIRILDGPFAGKKGWIDVNWVAHRELVRDKY
jgi:hypothetical protein